MTIITPTSTNDIADGAVTQIKLANTINISKFINDAGYASSIFELSDVGAFQPVDNGQVLAYSTLAGGWTNLTVSTDVVPEGSSNLYYTDNRVIDVIQDTNPISVTGEWTHQNALTVDVRGTGAVSGFTAISDTFSTTTRFKRQFAVGQVPFDTTFIAQADFEDTMANMITNPGYFGHSSQYRFSSASHPIDVDRGNGVIDSNDDTFLAGFNAYVSDYADDDNMSAGLSLSILNRVAQVETPTTVARFDKNGLHAQLVLDAQQGINAEYPFDNTLGDGNAANILNGALFLRGLGNVAPTGTGDTGQDGEFRFAFDGVGFYLYVYSAAIPGWLRTQFTTF